MDSLSERDIVYYLLDGEYSVKIENTKEIKMYSVYYDTEDNMFLKNKGALRIRKENEKSICCIKFTKIAAGACKSRDEYEVCADNLFDGLKLLPAAGAPQNICEYALSKKIIELCNIDFVRKCFTVKVLKKTGGDSNKDFIAELAFDFGKAERNNKKISISEIELEYKSGNEELFHSFAAYMENKFSLKEQLKSKLAQAMSL